MAERKFDYANVSNIYKEMQAITGDSSNPNSIAGILNEINKEVENKVEVMDEAVYGDLGKQLKLDWNNTSSSFNDFINNFNNWSTLIAQSAGKYAEFEKRVNGLKTTNPLGMTSGGVQSAYTNTGNYAIYTQDVYDYLSSLSSGELYSFTGAQYIDTNRVELEEKRKIMAGVNFGLQGVATVLSVIGGVGIVSAEVQAGKTILGGAGKAATNAALPATSSASATSQPALNSGNKLALPENSSASIASKSSSQWVTIDKAGNVNYGPGVTNMADSAVGTAGKSAVTGVGEIELQATTVGGKTVYSAASPKATAFGKVTGAVKNVGNNVANSRFGQAVANSKVGHAVSSKFSSAVSSVKGLGGKVTGTVTAAGNTIKNGVTSAGTVIKNGAVTTVGAIKNGVVTDIAKEVVTNPYVIGTTVAQGTSTIINKNS